MCSFGEECKVQKGLQMYPMMLHSALFHAVLAAQALASHCKVRCTGTARPSRDLYVVLERYKKGKDEAVSA